jgi:hypothetical protein
MLIATAALFAIVVLSAMSVSISELTLISTLVPEVCAADVATQVRLVDAIDVTFITSLLIET